MVTKKRKLFNLFGNNFLFWGIKLLILIRNRKNTPYMEYMLFNDLVLY